VLAEQVVVHLHDRLAVPRVHPHLVVADPAAQPQPRYRGPRRPHVDGQLPAQVKPRLALLVPGVGEHRLPVPLLEHQPNVDVLLQAAHEKLLAAGGHQDADRRQRPAKRDEVRVRVVNAEHAAVWEDGHDQLEKPAAHVSPVGHAATSLITRLAKLAAGNHGTSHKCRPTAPGAQPERLRRFHIVTDLSPIDYWAHPCSVISGYNTRRPP